MAKAATATRALERLVSRRACKIWLLGFFFCGVGIVHLTCAHTNFFRAGGATSKDDLPVLQEEIKTSIDSEHMKEAGEMHLYNAWSTLLDTTRDDEVPKNSDIVTRPPHLENCRLNWERDNEFDSYGDKITFPPWTLWKESLGFELFSQNYSEK
ncbi:hypothetical protein GUJ93_ZPchr0006g44922 [Zizania palustris]|uniref:Uncharacterized protein n=1 Tax=Zizania palustris TaxID=103762 RepID=A0A8J5T946_ZIZPA|nr:hypothetical protein GUJ93_ZPchr0006g44922 [Zizania palustris]